jgi:hypothetical protein
MQPALVPGAGASAQSQNGRQIALTSIASRPSSGHQHDSLHQRPKGLLQRHLLVADLGQVRVQPRLGLCGQSAGLSRRARRAGRVGSRTRTAAPAGARHA